jgi:geranyl-CoA carboxylase alpha subunit
VFNKVLVANRGEIAVRILRSIHAAGYGSVAVYSEADATAPHVRLADEAVCVGPARASDSYLSVDAIIQAAIASGADAVHPGYGFLSEREDFARACLYAGLVFIGPSPSAIALMGDKRVAKLRMRDAGVPCLRGYEGDDQSDAVMQAAALDIGFPLMVKAAAGGGGRGMRLVHDASQVESALKTVRQEALNAFGSEELILERALFAARHIEVQVACDIHGNAIHLGERDCSVQRRHQKVIEEAPSPFVDEALRESMGASAVLAAKACDYVGVGTVEFLVDEERNVAFLEMNTRLQVEHPVTELVTGVDLVDWQLKIAAGDTLPLAQGEVTLQGHAIEARLYAEDPAADFLPQTGTILEWTTPTGSGVRVDSGFETGSVVSPHYDSMLAKVIAFGDDREEARRRLKRAVRETRVLGLTTNIRWLDAILSSETFIQGKATTDVLTVDTALKPDTDLIAVAAGLLARDTTSGLEPWANVAPRAYTLELHCGGTIYKAAISNFGIDVLVDLDGQSFNIKFEKVEATRAVAVIDGRRFKVAYARTAETISLDIAGRSANIVDATHAPVRSVDGVGSGRLVSPTDGQIITVAVSAGDVVSKGDTIVTVEAMKMEHRLRADGDGTVESLHAQIGTQVRKGDLMAVLVLASTEAGKSESGEPELSDLKQGDREESA